MEQLPAKHQLPRLARIIPRPRLFRRLDQGRQRPLVWIGAPAGYGKTALVTSYLNQTRIAHLWYRIDPGDNVPAEFFRHLAHATECRFPGPSLPLPPARRFDPLRFGRFLLEAMVSRLPVPCLVGFDNCEQLDRRAPLYALLAMLGELLPGGVTVAVLSRHPPHPALARLRANQLLTCLEPAELLLTAEESARITALHRQESPASVPAEALHRESGGWPAGLVLLLQADTRGGDGRRLHPPPVPWQEEAVFDYFTWEIFRHFDARTRSVLLHAALLPDIRPAVLERLSTDPEAGAIIGRLHRQGLFVHAGEGTEPVYDLHPLFRRFLRARFRTVIPPLRQRRLQLRAGRLLARAGRTEAALACYLEAGEGDCAADLICDQAPMLLYRGRWQTLTAWIGRLPDGTVAHRPQLGYWQARARLFEAPALARTALYRIYHQFVTDRNPAWRLRTAIAVVESHLAQLSGFRTLDPWLERIRQLLHAHPACDPRLRAEAVLALYQGLLFRRPWTTELAPWREHLAEILREPAHPLWYPVSFSQLLHAYWCGRFSEAERILTSLAPGLAAPEAPPELAIQWRLFAATLAWSTGAGADQALDHLDAGQTVAARFGIRYLDAAFLSNRISACLSAGRTAAARRELMAMETRIDPANPFEQFLRHHAAIGIALQDNDLSRAASWQPEVLTTARRSGMPFHEALAWLAAATIELAGGRHQAAAVPLARAETIARGMASSLLTFECGLRRAAVLLAQGACAAGRKSLRRTLMLGRRHGFRAPMLRRSGWLARVLAEALRAGIEPDYARRLIRWHELPPPSNPVFFRDWPWPLRIRTLGGFALECHGRPVMLTPKPEQLLKALLAHGGREVDAGPLADLLWPDADGDAAHEAFKVTLRRLRRQLGVAQAVVLKHNRLSLDSGLCWVDALAFEACLEQAAAGDDPPARREAAFALYRGPFLAGDDDPCVLRRREHLHSRFRRLTLQLGETYRQADPERAIECYERALAVDDTTEQVYQGLMSCHLALGRRDQALQVYHRCRRALANRHGVVPTAVTRALADQARAG